MKRFIMSLKTMGIAFAMSFYKGAWTKKGKPTADLVVQGYAGMVLELIFPWRRNPQSVIAHKQAWLEKKQRRLDELDAEFEKLLDSNEIAHRQAWLEKKQRRLDEKRQRQLDELDAKLKKLRRTRD